MLSQVETQVGSPGGLAAGGPMWAPALHCALLAVTHMQVSMFEAGECHAIASELAQLLPRAQSGQLKLQQVKSK